MDPKKQKTSRLGGQARTVWPGALQDEYEREMEGRAGTHRREYGTPLGRQQPIARRSAGPWRWQRTTFPDVEWHDFTRHLDGYFHRIGLEPQRAFPFIGRRFRYRADRRVAAAIGPELMRLETWPSDTVVDHPEGELAAIFARTLGLHKWLHYVAVYEAAFGALRNRPLRFLEIGVDRGGSLTAWSEFFGPQAIIVGIDINPACSMFDDPASGRHVRIGDQADVALLGAVVAEFGPFDVILDDGSHRPSHTTASFRHLFDKGLIGGGLYLVEDLQTNYWTGFRDARRSFVDVAKGLVDVMHAQYAQVESETAFLLGGEERRRSFRVPRITKLVDSIEFYDSIVIIRRAVGDRPVPVSTYTADPTFVAAN